MIKSLIEKIWQDERGLTSLVVVIVVVAVALLIVTTAAPAMLSEIKTGLDQSKVNTVSWATDACMEEALLELSGNSSYSGEVMVINGVSCTIAVSGSGNTRTVDISSTLETKYVKDIQADVTLSPFAVTAWQELAN